jgi:hypothetical protein
MALSALTSKDWDLIHIRVKMQANFEGEGFAPQVHLLEAV